MKIKDLKDKSILILGLGREGKATLRFLKKHFPDKKIGTADQNDGENYLDSIEKFDVIIKSPGIPYLPVIRKAQKMGKIITSATNIFFENFKGKIIGITGTKGKSTTAALIYDILKQGRFDVYLVGNIGYPALDILDKTSKDSIVVYELSSFNLADLKKSPHIAVITNIYPDHLDWHGSFEDYKKAKENIGRFQKAGDIFISDKYAVEAATYVGKLFKLSKDKIKKAIRDFKPLPHRLEYIGELKGIKFYNDSLATNPHATIYGLKILGKNIETLIAGGFDRGVDYSVLGPAIINSGVKKLILFPTTGEKIWEAVCRSGKKRPEKFDANSMKEAVEIAFRVTGPEKICLMSPASASFNMFKDYKDRGDQFKRWVLSGQAT